MSTTDTERCEREGLTPDGEGLIVDCTVHGEIGRVQAGHHEAERGDALLARHRADTERDERLRKARDWAERLRESLPRLPGGPTAFEETVLALADEVTRLDAVVTAVRDLVSEDYQKTGREVSCGGYLATDDGCFAGSLAHRILRALDGGAR